MLKLTLLVEIHSWLLQQAAHIMLMRHSFIYKGGLANSYFTKNEDARKGMRSTRGGIVNAVRSGTALTNEIELIETSLKLAEGIIGRETNEVDDAYRQATKIGEVSDVDQLELQ